MTTEDFSFPTVHKSSSTRSIDFSPLWRPSPCYEDEEDHSTHVEEEEEEEDCNQRKSFACVEGVDDDQIIVGTGVLDQDEKMDMLWEDFNEELYPARSTTAEYVSGNMLQLGCTGLGAFNLPKSNAATSGSAITNQGMVLIVRVFKRLFFLHNSHHHNLNKPAKR